MSRKPLGFAVAMAAAAARAFDHGAGACAVWLARPPAAASALGTVLLWGLAGPAFMWSDAWLLVGNTGMSVVSYLVLFVILLASARDNAALHAKLDEIIVALPDARNELVAVEGLPGEQIAALRKPGLGLPPGARA